MSANCPHCNAAIEHLPGFVTQAKLEERLKQKTDLIEVIQADLLTARKASESIAAITKERDQFQGEIKRLTRAGALAERGIKDDKAIRTLELVYENEMADRPEAERVDFSEFDKWATDNPLLASLFAGQAGGAGGAGGAGAGSAGGRKLPTDQGGAQTPPPQTKRRTAEQISGIIGSPEFQKLTLPEKKAKLAEMEREDASVEP
jgi:hypothetical protein